jgi:hypothetical protein
METITISLNEYNMLKEEAKLLKDKEFMNRVNRLIDLIFQEKYGLYLGNNTDDLTEQIISDNFKKENSDWDKI